MDRIFDPWMGTPSMDEAPPPIDGWGPSSIGCPIHRYPFDPWMEAFDPWMGVSAAGVHHICHSSLWCARGSKYNGVAHGCAPQSRSILLGSVGLQLIYRLDNLSRTNNGKARRSQSWITRVLGRNYTATANEQIFHTPNLGVSINDRVSVILPSLRGLLFRKCAALRLERDIWASHREESLQGHAARFTMLQNKKFSRFSLPKQVTACLCLCGLCSLSLIFFSSPFCKRTSYIKFGFTPGN